MKDYFSVAASLSVCLSVLLFFLWKGFRTVSLCAIETVLLSSAGDSPVGKDSLCPDPCYCHEVSCSHTVLHSDSHGVSSLAVPSLLHHQG